MQSPVSLMPHAVCWAGAPGLIWTMVVTNGITFLSYSSICVTLLLLARRTRSVIARDWAYFVVGFALFIVACGSTHLLEVVTTWVPLFWVDAGTNVVTALLSAWVAMMLVRRAPVIAFSINDYARRLRSAEHEKLEMENSLLAAQKLQDWSKLSSTVSHEIRGPLETIHNLQYLIRTTEGCSPEIVALAQQASEEATKVLAISEATLSFIRQSAKPEKVDLCAAMDSVAFILAPVIRDKKIDFKVESDGDCSVEALAGEPRQVLLNLVRNACEAITRKGAHVAVTLSGQTTGVEIEIVDEGMGIDPAVLPTLFEFGRSTKGEHGNGMGLWSARHIVNKHRGRITVQSAAGQGTQFTLWWPRREDMIAAR